MVKEGAIETTTNIIDHIAANHPSFTIEDGVLETTFTDHHLVYVSRKINFRFCLSNKVKLVEMMSLAWYDAELFLADLPAINGQILFMAATTTPLA